MFYTHIHTHVHILDKVTTVLVPIFVTFPISQPKNKQQNLSNLGYII